MNRCADVALIDAADASSIGASDQRPEAVKASNS
jgi:hypothetical protein